MIDEARNLIKHFPGLFISITIHSLVFLLLGYITFQVPQEEAEPEDLDGVRIFFEGESKGPLGIPGYDSLDKLRVKDKIAYPLPVTDNRPTLPTYTFYPLPRAPLDLNLIGIESIDRKWAGTFTTAGKPLYTGEERLGGSFGSYIKVLREKGLDIVFVFDSTSSMAQVLSQIKFKVANLIATIKRLVPQSKIGLVTYRDAGDEYVTQAHPLTFSTGKLYNFLKQVEPGGGGDLEEAVFEALRVAIEDLTWREDTKKIILLIGDAPPHPSEVEATYQLIQRFKKKRSGVVSTLDTSFESNALQNAYVARPRGVIQEFRQIAALTGGESANLIEEEKVVKQLVVLIFGTRWEESLDEFLKEL